MENAVTEEGVIAFDPRVIDAIAQQQHIFFMTSASELLNNEDKLSFKRQKALRDRICEWAELDNTAQKVFRSQALQIAQLMVLMASPESDVHTTETFGPITED